MRGSLVIARDYKGCGLVRRVWEMGRSVIYLSEESQFQQLSTGCTGLIPVGFPVEDVFAYDPKQADGIASGCVDWSSLRNFAALSRQGQSTICVK
jgi:hypothetical protein